MDKPKVNLPLLGGCLCGRGRYTLNGSPLLVHVCHCHDCQKASGAAYSLRILVPTAALTLTGPVETFVRETPRGRKVRHSVCTECCTGLAVHDVAQPDYTSLHAGTLDDASWAVPIAQTFVRSAIPWAVIPGIEKIEPNAFSYVNLSAAWRATAPVFS